MTFWKKLFSKLRPKNIDAGVAPQIANSVVGFGDIVRIKESPETLAAKIANAQGTCFGQSVPSSSGVEVIGTPLNDYAINVDLGERGAFWLADHLVERVRHEPMTAEIGGKIFVSDEHGNWKEQSH